eukprot:TRINITY_DN3067_c0_g1_i8.p1 TRINITY_DN3067_c0_g1~~TRINITY_DN3067_c0_g1_i8.p1  ORF type:complete len:587 (-),score=118.80 TRINITY_DN3067_c0_g1_i8:255-2015(-)
MCIRDSMGRRYLMIKSERTREGVTSKRTVTPPPLSSAKTTGTPLGDKKVFPVQTNQLLMQDVVDLLQTFGFHGANDNQNASPRCKKDIERDSCDESFVSEKTRSPSRDNSLEVAFTNVGHSPNRVNKEEKKQQEMRQRRIEYAENRLKDAILGVNLKSITMLRASAKTGALAQKVYISMLLLFGEQLEVKLPPMANAAHWEKLLMESHLVNHVYNYIKDTIPLIKSKVIASPIIQWLSANLRKLKPDLSRENNELIAKHLNFIRRAIDYYDILWPNNTTANKYSAKKKPEFRSSRRADSSESLVKPFESLFTTKSVQNNSQPVINDPRRSPIRRTGSPERSDFEAGLRNFLLSKGSGPRMAKSVSARQAPVSPAKAMKRPASRASPVTTPKRSSLSPQGSLLRSPAGSLVDIDPLNKDWAQEMEKAVRELNEIQQKTSKVLWDLDRKGKQYRKLKEELTNKKEINESFLSEKKYRLMQERKRKEEEEQRRKWKLNNIRAERQLRQDQTSQRRREMQEKLHESVPFNAHSSLKSQISNSRYRESVKGNERSARKEELNVRGQEIQHLKSVKKLKEMEERQLKVISLS